MVDVVLQVYCFTTNGHKAVNICGIYSSVNEAFKKFAVSLQKNTKFYQNRPGET